MDEVLSKESEQDLLEGDNAPRRSCSDSLFRIDQHKDNDNQADHDCFHNHHHHPHLPQVDEVLSKESEQDLLEGDNPGPMPEIHFWEAKSVVVIVNDNNLDFEYIEKFDDDRHHQDHYDHNHAQVSKP